MVLVSLQSLLALRRMVNWMPSSRLFKPKFYPIFIPTNYLLAFRFCRCSQDILVSGPCYPGEIQLLDHCSEWTDKESLVRSHPPLPISWSCHELISPFILAPKWLVKTDLRPEKHKSPVSVIEDQETELANRRSWPSIWKFISGVYPWRTHFSWLMLLPPTGWLESVSGKEQWLFCRCSKNIPHCACLLLQPVCGSAYAKSIKSLLCPKRSHLAKDVLASHETHMHSTLFWLVLAPPFLDTAPWCWLLTMLVWLQDYFTWQSSYKRRHGDLAKLIPDPSFSFASCMPYT